MVNSSFIIFCSFFEIYVYLRSTSVFWVFSTKDMIKRLLCSCGKAKAPFLPLKARPWLCNLLHYQVILSVFHTSLFILASHFTCSVNNDSVESVEGFSWDYLKNITCSRQPLLFWNKINYSLIYHSFILYFLLKYTL